MISIIKNIKNVFFENKAHFRDNIKSGMKVVIIMKKRGRYETKKEGIVKDVLTKKSKHTRGIKVRLKNGQIGRVLSIKK